MIPLLREHPAKLARLRALLPVRIEEKAGAKGFHLTGGIEIGPCAESLFCDLAKADWDIFVHELAHVFALRLTGHAEGFRPRGEDRDRFVDHCAGGDPWELSPGNYADTSAADTEAEWIMPCQAAVAMVAGWSFGDAVDWMDAAGYFDDAASRDAWADDLDQEKLPRPWTEKELETQVKERL